MRQKLAIVAALALAALGAGCGKNMVEPAIEVEDRRMAILPLKDRLHHHFESERGIKVAEALAAHLEQRHEELGDDDAIEVVPYDELATAVQAIHEDPKNLEPVDIARRVNANLVLLGDLKRFETKLPGDVGFNRGRASVDVRVIEIARPKKPLLVRTISVVYPPEGLKGTGVLAPGEMSEEDLEAKLVSLLVEEVGKLFYVHESEEDED